jgi:predicted permease
MKWRKIRKRDADLERELHSDLELEEEERREDGASPDEAHYAALRAFGNPALIREQTHATWSWSWLESLARDLRISLRTLRRTPGFTIIAIVVMALGIGANVALFTVVRGVLLKPLPFEDPDRLVMLYECCLDENDTAGHNVVSPGMYAEWKKHNQSFSNLALVKDSRVGMSGSGGQLPEKLASGEFSWDLLRTLGVQPALGRDFTQSDDRPSANGTVLLSWGLWKRRFGGDRGILNQTIYLDAEPYTVIGIMPAWFDFPNSATQLWTPIYRDWPEGMMTSFSKHMFRVVGRLKPGVNAAQGVADLSLISRRIHNERLSEPWVFKGANSRSLLEHIVGDIKKPLYLLLEATYCLLLIACLNVANLLVARAAARRKELAIRTALGGGWLRLMRERLMESLLLSAAGGALGLAMAASALVWLRHTRADMSRVESIHIDGVVAVFTVGIIVLCALFSGLIAAFSASDKRVLSTLHEASRSVGGGARARLRKVLLMVEVGLTVVLLIGAGLLLKSYERLRSADMGCITQDVLTMHIGIPDARYAKGAARVNFFDTLLERVRAVPGVDAAGFVTVVPGEGYWGDWGFTIVEHPPLAQGAVLDAIKRWADAKYFAAIGIPILRGRTFDESKRVDAANEVIISQAFANQYFPGEDPIGKHVNAALEHRVAEIVGIVGDTRYIMGEKPQAMMYFPLNDGMETVGTLVIRSNHNVEQYALPVQRIVSKIDPDLPVSDVLTMNQLLGKNTSDQSFNATLLTAFAALSLLLAAVGLFGVMSYIAAQRTTEIGIRIALGAKREHVMRKMLLDGMRPAVLGLAVGLAVSLEAGRLMRDLLYEIKPLDPSVFAAVAVTLLAVAAFACIVPAWRASRLDPMQALRSE